MNRHEIAQECEKKFSTGEIGSCSIKELHEYLIAMSDFTSAPAAKYSERSSHIQILNSLISVKTIKVLNNKNSLLTWVVIVLAAFSLIATCTQTYFTVTAEQKQKKTSANTLSQQTELQHSQKQGVVLKNTSSKHRSPD